METFQETTSGMQAMTWSSSAQPVTVNKGSPERPSPPGQLPTGKTGQSNQRRGLWRWSWSQGRFKNLRRMVRWNIIRRQQKTAIHPAGLCTRISSAVRCGGIHIQVHRILPRRGWKRYHMEWSGHRHRLATGRNRRDNPIRQGQEMDELQGFENQVLNLHTSWSSLLTKNQK